MNKLIFWCFLLTAFIISCKQVKQKQPKKKQGSLVIFEDKFGKASEGEYRENIIGLPEPEGLGYTWEVLPGGNNPVNWIMSDECEPSDPKKGFWVIPADSGYMHQGGRSHNSVLFANKSIPKHVVNYDIEFRQKRSDNDAIMFLLGAPNPNWEWTTEIGYEIQVPGTDSTTNDAYVSGVLGESIIEGAAFHHVWANHKIEVRGESIKWYCNDFIMAEGEIEGLKPGYFGIRHRYERNTFYDDFKIIFKDVSQ